MRTWLTYFVLFVAYVLTFLANGKIDSLVHGFSKTILMLLVLTFITVLILKAADFLQLKSSAKGALGKRESESETETSKMQPKVEEFTLDQLLDDVIDIFSPFGLKNCIDCILDPRDASILKFYLVRGDREKLKDILNKLLKKAIMSTKPGHITIRAIAQRPTQGLPLSGKRLLVVEHDELLRDEVVESLVLAGANVDVCKDGNEARELVRSMNKMKGDTMMPVYNYILMDCCEGPLMNGYHTSRLIRGNMKSNGIDNYTPIIALVPCVTATVKTKVTKAGIDFYLKKPLQIQELLDIICG